MFSIGLILNLHVQVQQQYAKVPKELIEDFVKCCTSCVVRRKVKTPVLGRAIISVGFMTRLQVTKEHDLLSECLLIILIYQIDLIDFRNMPDGDFQWIAHAKCHYSKFSWAQALTHKKAK